MAVQIVRQLSEDTTITDDGATIRQEFQAVDDEIKDNSIAAYNAAWAWTDAHPDAGVKIPKSGGYYSGYPSTRVKNIKIKRAGQDRQEIEVNGQRKTGYVWSITAEYGPYKPNQHTFSDGSAKISARNEYIDHPEGRFDLDGKWNCSTLGEWFAEPLPLKDKVKVWTFQTYSWRNPSYLTYLYDNCVNDAPHWGFPEGTLLCRNIREERLFNTSIGIYYWNVNLEVAYNPQGWLLKKANAGFYAYDVESDEVLPIYGNDGTLVSKPQLLNENGTVMEDSSCSAEPHWLDFRIYETADFSALNLPDPTE